jgi:hypothetical protein
MTRLLLLCTLVAAQASWALTSSARLLPDEAPVSAAAAAEPAATPPPTEARLTPTPQEPIPMGYQFAAGAVTGLVFTPMSFYVANLLGNLTIDTPTLAVLALLPMGLIPPLAITTATWLAGNWRTPGRYKWWPSFLATLVINCVSLPIAAAVGQLGLSIGMFSRVLIYSIAQAVLQPAAATALMRAWPNEQAPTVITNHDPVAPTTYVVRTSSWSF